MADSAPRLQSPNFPIGTTLLTYRGHPTGANVVCWSPMVVASLLVLRMDGAGVGQLRSYIISYREH